MATGSTRRRFWRSFTIPLVTGEADAVFGSRMMRTYGGPLKGGMPLYKYVGNRILTILENRALGLNLTEFHSGYRAYNLHALAQLDFSRMTNDFHFDTEIIIKLHHQAMKIREVPIPTYYGTELCNVDGLKYAKDVVRSVWRYRRTCRSVMRAPEFAEYFVHYPIKHSKHSSHYYARQLVGRNQDVLDVGCGEGFFAAELKKDGNRIVGVDALPTAGESAALERYISADLNVAAAGPGAPGRRAPLRPRPAARCPGASGAAGAPAGGGPPRAEGERAAGGVGAQRGQHHGAPGAPVRTLQLHRSRHSGSHPPAFLHAQNGARLPRGKRLGDRRRPRPPSCRWNWCWASTPPIR